MSRWKWLLLALGLALLAIAATVAYFTFGDIQHFFGFATGQGNDPQYLFPSGFGGILERLVELVVIGGILLRRHNCHQKGCPRLGRFPAVEGNGWLYCQKHHRDNGEHRDRRSCDGCRCPGCERRRNIKR